MSKARRYKRTIAKLTGSTAALKAQIETRDASRQRPVLEAKLKEAHAQIDEVRAQAHARLKEARARIDDLEAQSEELLAQSEELLERCGETR